MEKFIKNISVLICGIVIGGSIAIAYYTKQITTQHVEGLEEDMKSSDRHLRHVAYVYYGILEASEKGEGAMLPQAYYGFGTLSDQLDEKDKEKHQKEYVAFLTSDCEKNVYESCVYLGEYHIKKKQYDKALPVLLKSASNNNLKAMSLLVDLYRVKSWTQANEETARYWMMKLGKNG